MKRSEAREKVFQIIFQMDFYDDFSERYPFMMEEMGLKGNAAEKYAERTIRGILDNLDEIDRIISENLRSWSLERLPKQTRAILRLGVYELCFAKDIPPLPAIDEAVKLAGTYCDEKDIGFVNGVLNNLYHQKKEEE